MAALAPRFRPRDASIPLTCTNAVAIRTPVPKCLQMKNVLAGTLTHLTFFATTGKPAPRREAAKTRTRSMLLVDNTRPGVVGRECPSRLTQGRNVEAKIILANLLTAPTRRLSRHEVDLGDRCSHIIGHCVFSSGVSGSWTQGGYFQGWGSSRLLTQNENEANFLLKQHKTQKEYQRSRPAASI